MGRKEKDGFVGERERGLGTSMGGRNKGMVQSDIMKEESGKKVEYDSQNGRK